MESELCRAIRLEASPLDLPRVPTRSRQSVPALLVSVRNAVEAVAALNGGCDILDVKEPRHGPLGMASIEEIRAVVAARDAVSRSAPVSVALGELKDWSEIESFAGFGAGISFLKFGTGGLSGDEDLWQTFTKFRLRFARPSGVDDSQAVSHRFIAVAYADWQAAKAPHPRAVAEAVVQSGCDGLLIDTFCKTGGGLLENLALAELKACAAIVRQEGRSFALAGRLGLGHLERVLELGPEIIGIRSAACREGRRDLEVDARSVEQFRRVLRQTAEKALTNAETAT